MGLRTALRHFGVESRRRPQHARRHRIGFAAASIVLTAAATVVLPATPASASVLSGSWSELSASSGPTARYDAASAWDPAASETVLFGGRSAAGVAQSDTWTYKAGAWSGPITGGPSARYGASMVYDATTGQVVLFGGNTGSAPLADTWVFSGGTWTNLGLSAGASPPARSGASTAYDPASGSIILFGGRGASGELGDTWRFAAGAWQRLSPATSPSAREGAALAWDPAAQDLVLFGGLSAGFAQDDTWTWRGSSWSAAGPLAWPSARYDASMTWDAATGQLVIFGGTDGTTPAGDTWQYAAGEWTQEATASGPAARQGGAADYDAAVAGLLLFGGLEGGGTAVNDTWSFALPSSPAPGWSNPFEARSATGRNLGALAFDDATGQMLVYGGQESGSDNRDTWTWNGSTWTNLGVSPPDAYWGMALAYDPATRDLVMYGGSGNATLDETWVWDGHAWSNVTPASGNPLPLVNASLAYDPATGTMLLFGGRNPFGGGPAISNQTWSWDGSAWTNVTPASGNPAARYLASMSYDEATGQMLLFGGANATATALADTWTWNGSAWSQLSPSASPPGTEAGTLDFDPATGQELLFGGDDESAPYGTTWLWSGTTWNEASPPVSPQARTWAQMAYDTATSELVLFGGTPNFASTNYDDTWLWSYQYRPGAPTGVTATAGAGDASVAFTAPADGTSAATFLVVATDQTTPANGGQSANGGGSPITVFSLTPGDSYTFTVTAYDDTGPGPVSAPSAPVTPSGPPGAPGTPSATAGSKATAGDGQVNLSWTAPSSGGSSITGYAVTPSPACPACTGLSPAGTSTTIGHLTPGTSYTFKVAAVNTAGAGPNSASSGPVVTTTVPGAPSRPSGTLTLAGAVVLAWKAPTTKSGLALKGYVVAPSPACSACTGLTAAGATTTITGLTKGTTYTFTVVARDADGTGPRSPASAGVKVAIAEGYWLATANGHVFGAGASVGHGGVSASSGDPVVGIAATPDGKGYVVVTRDGAVAALGDAHFYGDLPAKGVAVQDIVTVVVTTDGKGYWLAGADGSVYVFGDALFHNDLPGIHVKVSNVVAMLATPGGTGYQLVGSDGGVFAFGATHFFGSLPGIGVKVNDIRGILPSAADTGYVLVGADGGAFVFGHGVHFYGSLPGRGIKVDDIVGLALTPDDLGYFMSGSNGAVYGFGDAVVQATPAGLSGQLPVTAIAGV